MLPNAEHKDDARFRCNLDAGSARPEMIIVDSDGTVDWEIPVKFEDGKATDVTIINVKMRPLKVPYALYWRRCRWKNNKTAKKSYDTGFFC